MKADSDITHILWRKRQFGGFHTQGHIINPITQRSRKGQDGVKSFQPLTQPLTHVRVQWCVNAGVAFKEKLISTPWILTSSELFKAKTPQRKRREDVLHVAIFQKDAWCWRKFVTEQRPKAIFLLTMGIWSSRKVKGEISVELHRILVG